MSDIDKHNAQGEKIDPADGTDTTETFLPGQIPVTVADDEEFEEARAEERQPDPVQAVIAVNPEDLKPEITNRKDRKAGE